MKSIALSKSEIINPAELLRGAVDMHVHTAPDIFERCVDDIDATGQAKQAGMAAIVIKSHLTITADRAQIASKVVGFPVFGGVTLNHWVGGLNVFAIKAAIGFGAKIVWMPTICAENYLRHATVDMFTKAASEAARAGAGISVLTDKNELVPEIEPILRLIAENNVALGTAHLSAMEAKILVEEAGKIGVTKIIVQHPQISFMNYSIEDMKELIRSGAFMEHDYAICLKVLRPEERVNPETIAEAIKELGYKNCIMATDSGQKINPPPVKVLEMYVGDMLKCGITESEINTMTTTNPMKILGSISHA